MLRRFTLGLAVMAILMASACSDDSATTETSPPAQEPSAAPVLPVSYTAHDFGYDGPDTLPAGTSDITMENEGAVGHEMLIIRLDKHQDWTEQQAIDYVTDKPKAEPKWAVPVGGLFTEAGPPVIAPGESAPVVFLDFSAGGDAPNILENGSLEPGTYLLMCFVGNPAHATQGMVKKITVS